MYDTLWLLSVVDVTWFELFLWISPPLLSTDPFLVKLLLLMHPSFDRVNLLRESVTVNIVLEDIPPLVFVVS